MDEQTEFKKYLENNQVIDEIERHIVMLKDGCLTTGQKHCLTPILITGSSGLEFLLRNWVTLDPQSELNRLYPNKNSEEWEITFQLDLYQMIRDAIPQLLVNVISKKRGFLLMAQQIAGGF